MPGHRRCRTASAAEAIDIAVLLHAARGDRTDVAALDALQQRAAPGGIDADVALGAERRAPSPGCTARRTRPSKGCEVLAELGDVEGVGFYGSEVYRVEGELRRRVAPQAPDDAARCFQQAIDLARRRELRSLELRAATSLARLWRDQGKHTEAPRPSLAPVYATFAEGFTTRDLIDAKALLDELAR